MKRNYKSALIAITMLFCSCSGNMAETVQTITTPETTTTTTAQTTTTPEITTTTTTVQTTTTTTAQTTTTPETTTTTTTAQTTTTPETTTTTTAQTTTTPETTTTTTTVQTTTTPETTTTPKTKKTKKTKNTKKTVQTTTTPHETEPPEIIPESGIYTSRDGILYIDGSPYQLTFSDEFEGENLDMTKWEYCPEWQRQNVNCYWRNSAVSLDSGNLCITSGYDGSNYIMGGIRSKGKFEQAYGYFEVKCTLNTIPGYWSAFWLLCEEVMNENNSGVDGTEIDIMESAFFDKSQVNHALNWDGYGAAQKAVWYQTEKEDLYDGNYHTFSLLWTQDEYVFYVDGVESCRTKAEEAGGVSTAPSYLKFTTETGMWTKDSLDNTKLPDNVYVDYIRVYCKSE